MRDILKKMGFTPEYKITWQNLDQRIKTFIITRCILLLFSLLIIIPLGIVVGLEWRVWIVIVIVLCICSFGILKNYLYFTYSKYEYIEGNIAQVEQPVKEKNKALIHPVTYGKSYMIVDCNDVLFNVPINHAMKLQKGALVKVYFEKNSVSVETENSAKILNPVFIITEKASVEQQ